MTPEELGHFAELANGYYSTHYLSHLLFEGNYSLNNPFEKVICKDDDGADGFIWCRNLLWRETELAFADHTVKLHVHGHDSGSSMSPFAAENMSPFAAEKFGNRIQGKQTDPTAPAGNEDRTIVNLDQDCDKNGPKLTNPPPPSKLYLEGL
jgi:hypothetical protein